MRHLTNHTNFAVIVEILSKAGRKKLFLCHHPNLYFKVQSVDLMFFFFYVWAKDDNHCNKEVLNQTPEAL